MSAPREPTKEMVLAGETALEDCIDSDWDSGPDGKSHNSYTTIRSGAQSEIWRAMWDAAPAPPPQPDALWPRSRLDEMTESIRPELLKSSWLTFLARDLGFRDHTMIHDAARAILAKHIADIIARDRLNPPAARRALDAAGE